jgi:hypothetical protein
MYTWSETIDANQKQKLPTSTRKGILLYFFYLTKTYNVSHSIINLKKGHCLIKNDDFE